MGNEDNAYRAVFEGLADAVLMLDRDNRILNLNRAARALLEDQELFGSQYHSSELAGEETPHQAIGCSVLDVLPWLEPIVRGGRWPAGRDTFEVQVKMRPGRRYFEVKASHMLNAAETPAMLVLTLVDVTEKRIYREMIQQSEAQYRNLLDNIPQRVFFKDVNSVYLTVNPSYAADFGCTPAEFFGKTDHDFYPDDLARKYTEDDRRVMESGATEEFDETYVHLGTENIVHTVKTPVYDDQGKVSGILGIFWDVTSARKAAEKVREISEFNEKILNSSPRGILVYTEGGDCVFANKAAAVTVGAGTTEDVMALNFNEIESWQESGLYTAAIHALESGVERKMEVSMETSFGRRVWLHCLLTRFTQLEKPHLLLIVEDITERKAAERDLKRYAETQEVLLREVNHRVKNNLAAVISMLHREEDRAEEQGVSSYLPLLQQLTVRVKGLATVHSLLTSSGWHPLRLDELCRKLIASSLNTLPPTVETQYDVTGCETLVNSNQAHHLALVVNELVTNSVKYACPGNTEGRIAVLLEEKNGRVTMCYRDNGPGFPHEVLEGESSSVGMGLLRGIVTQNLDGKISFANDRGAVVTISFENEHGESPES